MRDKIKNVLAVLMWIIIIGGGLISLYLTYVAYAVENSITMKTVTTFVISLFFTMLLACIPMGLYAIIDGQDIIIKQISVRNNQPNQPLLPAPAAQENIVQSVQQNMPVYPALPTPPASPIQQIPQMPQIPKIAQPNQGIYNPDFNTQNFERPETSVLTSELKKQMEETSSVWTNPIPKETFSIDPVDSNVKSDELPSVLPEPESIAVPEYMNEHTASLVEDEANVSTIFIEKTSNSVDESKKNDNETPALRLKTDKFWECPLCKARMAMGDVTCVSCGYDPRIGTETEKECKYCHKMIKADATYCIHCGAYV